MKLLPFDLETTSPEPATTRAVQLAALLHCLVSDTEEVLFNTYCNPGLDISDGAAEVHGITSEMVKDAEPDEVWLGRMYDYLEANHHQVIVAGHNCITFDIPILYRVTNRPRLPIRVIDTITCATRCYPDAPDHKLGTLHEWLGLGSAEGAHDALADIRMVRNLVRHFCEGLGKTIEELAEWCAAPRILETCHFGKHKGKKWGRGAGCVPFGYVCFITDKFTYPSPDMRATIWHHYRKRFKCRG